MVSALLRDTCLSVRIEGERSEWFHTTIGTPQGDCLSPVLFIVYLEAALRNLRAKLGPRPTADLEANLPPEMVYADDTDLVSLSKEWLENALAQIPAELATFSLIANAEKTEWTEYCHESERWRTTRKLGSRIGETEDMHHRANQAAGMYASMDKLWRQHKLVNTKIRMQMFRNYVEPCFTYACGTWGTTQGERNWFEAQHRRLLRKAIGIQYPKRISNRALHKVTGVPPLRLTITRERWRLFRQCLNLPQNAPAQQAMDMYVNPPGKASAGRPKSMLPYSIHQELKEVKPDVLQGAKQLFTAKTLAELRIIASNDIEWERISSKAEEVAISNLVKEKVIRNL